jgi:myxalamid-type polyketide synthase MxaE and MxaD
MNIASTLAHGRRQFPDRPAIVFEGETIAYGDLDRAACRAAHVLRGLGVGAGDRVALLLPNVPAFAYAYFGALKLGAIVVSINTGLTVDEARFVIEDSGAETLIVSDTLRHGDAWSSRGGGRPPSLKHVLVSGGAEPSFEQEMARASGDADAMEMAPADPAVIVYTSGTTGVPKGATLSHGNVTFAMAAKQRYLDIRPDDRLLLFLPLYHCFGQNAILNAGLQAGATIVLQRGFDAGRVLEAVTRDRVTMLFGVPATFIVLQERADVRDLGLVRYCFSAAAPLPVRVETAWRDKFGLVIHQGYGLTETSPFASYNHATHHRPGSIGAPIDDVEMDVVDVHTRQRVAEGEIGEIIIRGPNVMLGYWNRPADTAEAIQDGWFRTGDLGRRDGGGYFFIEDRLKDLVIVGGSNVYPMEVETVLAQHPAIADVAVYGVPDPVLGERVRAAIVLAATASAVTATTTATATSTATSRDGALAPVTEADILAWCRGRLAAFKTPSAVDFVAELPRNRTGKVLKRVLRDDHAAAHPADAATAAIAATAIAATATGASVDASARLADGTAHEADTIQRWIARRLDAMLDLRGEPIDRDRPVIEYGATSIDAVELASALEQWLGRPVPPTIVWHFPTLRTLASHLASTKATVPGSEANVAEGKPEEEPIAIVGMGCRYPGADGLDAFWDLLRHGRDAVTEVPKSRWDLDAVYDPDPAAPGKMASRWAGLIERLDEFDAAFFGISPREAPHVDPRQRLALEVAWEALENAKIPPDSLAGTRTGVFMATLTNDYDHLLFNDLHRADAYSGAGTANSIVANRLSYFLDLRGPSLALDTACSGSLVAVHLACESLRRGESTLALAGGVNVNLMAKSNVFFSKAGALSPNGRCRTFDRAADGMVRSDGAGIIVLKTLSQARRDGDTIVALIKGTAVNHDGRSNGLMAPNGEAQQAVLTEAYRRAGVAPADVQYIEAHGTGTRLGDPIEVQALGAVLTQARPADRRCLLGSVKTNIGHSEAAAAIAGVIKTALAMKHRVVPPSLHFTEPNPLIAFDRLPFDVPREASPWPTPGAPLIAGVSGFGFGGANAHLVLREAPAAIAAGAMTSAARTADSATSEREIRHVQIAHGPAVAVAPQADGIAAPYVLPVSARTPQALRALARAYRDRLAAASETATETESEGANVDGAAPTARVAHASNATDDADAGEICAAAATGRTHHTHRLALVGASRDELQAKLDRWLTETPPAAPAHAQDGGGRLVFVFSGQGSHWPRMASDLYASEPKFQVALDECDRLFERLAGWSLIEEIGRDAAQSRLDDTEFTQPAIFAVQWALFSLWRSFGIVPDAIVGHSLGEVAAACAAGAISLADGVRIVFHRSRLMKRAAGHGRTAVVGLSFADAREAIHAYEPSLAVAGSNSPSASVVAGDPASIERLLADLSARQVFCRVIPGVDIAFHSPQMDPLREELVQALAGLTPKPPVIPILSTVTGTFAGGVAADPASPDNSASLANPAPAFDAAYWGRNLREPFLFAHAVDRLLTDGCRAFIEVSPHTVLSSSITQCVRHAGSRVVPVLCSMRRSERERATLLEQLALLYERGESVDWTSVYSGRTRVSSVALPTYPWQRQRFWFDQLSATPAAEGAGVNVGVGMGASAGAGASTSVNANASEKRAGAHPLLGERIEPAAHDAAGGMDRLCLWEMDFDATHPAYFADHRVMDDVVVPGAALLEMAMAAARQVWGDRPIAVSGLRFEQALRLTDAGRRVQASLSVRGDAAEFQLYSRPAQDGLALNGAAPLAWTRHVTGRVEVTPEDVDLEPAAVSLSAIGERCGDEVSPEQHYEMMQRGGLAYGPAFRGVRQLWSGADEAFADLRLAPALADPRYAVHPAMLDAALQIVAAAVGQDDTNSYLPRGVERWRVFRPTSDRVWCHARLTPAAGSASDGDSDALRADIDLIDESGRVVAQLQGLALMRVGARRRNPLEDSLIEERWEPLRIAAARPAAVAAAPATAVVPAWLVLSDATAVGDLIASSLRARGHEVTVVRPGAEYRRVSDGQIEVRIDRPEDMTRLIAEAGRIDGVAHLWSLNTRPPDEALEALDAAAMFACGSALHLAQALVAAESAARLWLVTSRALAVDDGPLDVQQAPLTGLALVIAQEHPELRCTSVDLDADDAVSQAAHLVEEFLSDHDETRVAWRARTRSVARIAPMTLASPAPAAAAASDIRLRRDATYLITGGLGALGLRTAAAFAARGAGHLVLTGRRGRAGTSAATLAKIAAIERRGATVTIVAADVADPADVDRLFTAVLADLPPLAGVVHAAGVLNDAVIGQQSLDRLRTVMAPKVRGAWNLHLHTRDRALDFFVCYSSAASLVGSPGQGNYAAGNAFMDALAHHRRALGLPAASINWGAWEGDGMAATAQMRSRMAARGVSSIRPGDGMAILFKLLAAAQTTRAAVGVMPVEWSRFLQQFPAGVPARFEALAAAADAAAAAASAEAGTSGTSGASGAPGAARTLPRDLWRSAPRGERVAVLRRCVTRELAAVLGFDASAEIAPRERYFDLGMDSLTAVEFKNRLQQAFGVALPATLAFEYPTVDALAQLLDESLGLQEGDDSTAEAPSQSSSSSHATAATATASASGPDAEAARAAAADADLDALSTDEIARLLASELASEVASRPPDKKSAEFSNELANESRAGSPNQLREEVVRVR